MAVRTRKRGSEARFTLLGVGAMNSPRYRPAGVLVEFLGYRIMLDGGSARSRTGVSTPGWLLTNEVS